MRNKYKNVQFLDLSNSLFNEGKTLQWIIAPFRFWTLIERDTFYNEVLIRNPLSYAPDAKEQRLILCGPIADAWTRSQTK